jgi:sugar transferase (PEP-CTERM system associated)
MQVKASRSAGSEGVVDTSAVEADVTPALTPHEMRAADKHSMFRLFQKRRSAALLLEVTLDTCLGTVALLLAAVTVEGVAPGAWAGLMGSTRALATAFGFGLVIAMWQASLGVYNGPARTFAAQASRMLASVLIGAYLAYLATKAQGADGHPGRLLAYSVTYLLLLMVLVRGGVATLRALGGTARVLIVGTSVEAQSVVEDLSLLEGPLPREVVGYFPTTEVAPELDGQPVRELDRHMSLVDHVKRLKVREIIVAAREQRGGIVPMDDLLRCRSMGIPVMDASGFYERTHGEVPLESLKASWLVYGAGFVQGWTRRALKRSFDIVVSLLLLAITTPVMLFAALLIRLESRGPVIYTQERVGLNGDPFTCMKFRSMVVDAEGDGVAKWASKNDPRITRVGKFIRQTRIDELPQLISVLRGEMSLVGPRPERPSFVHHLSQQVAFYDLRHTVKPGVTGWAQVRYAYGASLEDARRKHQFDLYYVKNNSLLLDVLILLETVGVVLQREGQ